MRKKIIATSALLFFVFSICMWQTSFVAAEYKLLESVPWGKKDTVVDFPTYVEGLYNFAVAFVAIAALLMITIGGFYYIISAGNQSQAGTAKTIIKDALLGLVVVFVTWLILKTINPDLLNIAPDVSKIQGKTTQQTK